MAARSRLLSSLLLLALGMGALSSPGPRTTAQPPAEAPTPAPDELVGELTVFAAASLSDAFESLATAWTSAYPRSRLILALDASSALRAQIEQGAPADVFASADTRNAQRLVDAGLATGPITPFAGNELVLVVPADDPADIASPADLARDGVRIVGAGPEVPITRYAHAVIARLAELEGYPPDFVAAVSANIVSEEANVRAVLAKVELAEADAALVYATDARSSREVETIELPAAANVAAEYAVVRLHASDQPALAATFIDFLAGPAGQAVLGEYGFVPPPSAARGASAP